MNHVLESSAGDDFPKLIPTRTLAKILSVSERTVQRLVQQHKVPKPLYVGKNPRWPLNGITRWLDEGCPPDTE